MIDEPKELEPKEEIKIDPNQLNDHDSLNRKTPSNKSSKSKNVGFAEEEGKPEEDQKIQDKLKIEEPIKKLEAIIHGLIEWGEFNEADGLCCTYNLVAGDKWDKIRV